jgi:hypothetical protein
MPASGIGIETARALTAVQARPNSPDLKPFRLIASHAEQLGRSMEAAWLLHGALIAASLATPLSFSITRL